jgi:hypothetical protein
MAAGFALLLALEYSNWKCRQSICNDFSEKRNRANNEKGTALFWNGERSALKQDGTPPPGGATI